ncbi:MAG TPA: dTDP-4-dehydrorhamnose 3,5-epimerase [Allosphingosinicella sp.]|jgi:dTDP-4-dehydrorhamnose 3,5-epimerase|uniref:dTDP-4-dehydrorhamnose 3,5-epimerase n=1 Tax=Allosphingosinicella sp. TaxID=2823234 RepID=UPI002F299FAA
MIEVRGLTLPSVLEIRPERHWDERGFFSETWSGSLFAAAGVHVDWVQDNHSYSSRSGVLRGLHYQLPPAAQARLVRASRGSVFDVAVDLRLGSPTFGRWTGLILSAQNWNQVFIPAGFAHGFVTLEDGSEVQYKVSAPYRPDLERSIRFDDPAIGIDWPIGRDELVLSSKDSDAPLFGDAELPASWQ